MIKYTKSRRSRRKKNYDLTLIVFGVIAVMIGIEVLLVVMSLFAVGIILKAVQPPYFNFEIELNRRTNLISIKNSDQVQPKVTTYPLAHFNGFGFRELEQSEADLFLKIEPSIGLFQKIPIWKFEHPVPLANAIKIIDATDEWLRLADDLPAIEEVQDAEELPQEPVQEPEIIRDFRDMD